MATLIPKLKLKNFNPTPDVMKILKRSMDRLIDLAPSDSYVGTIIEERAGAYHCEISVNSTQKRWSVLKKAALPAEALVEAVGSLLKDLTTWKKNRFN
jgi:hypothetical protein